MFYRKQQNLLGAKISGSVLVVQCVISLFLVVVILLLRVVLPERYQQIRGHLQPFFSLQENSGELVRFAQALVDSFFVSAQAASVPDGCSQDSYLPTQSVVSPLAEYYVSSEYGWRVHPISGEKSFHNGIDLAANEGAVLVCPMDGMVQYTGYDGLNGNYIVLRHEDGVELVLCHMQYIFARAGEFLAAGQLLGTVGQTGSATGPHLHLVLKCNGVRYNPAEMLGL